MKKKDNPLPLFSLLFVMFIDALGVGIILPVISYLFLGDATPFMYLSLQIRVIIIGVLVAISPLAQFFGAPFFGALSDRIGRKKVLLISLFSAIIGYVLFAIGIIQHDLILIFIGRILDGAAGGNYAIALATISDISTSKTRNKNFSYVAIAFGAGLAIGPYIGGKLAEPPFSQPLGTATPFWFAAFIVIINLLLVSFFFHETIKKRSKTKLTPLTGFKNVVSAFKIIYLRNLFLLVFIFNFANLLLLYFCQVFFISKYGFTPSQLADIIGYYIICLVVTQLFITPYITKRVHTHTILAWTFIIMALLFTLMPFVPLWIIMVIFLFTAIAQGLTYISLISAISNASSNDARGKVLGINQSIESFAQILSLLLAGGATAITLYLPIWIAGAFLFCGWIIVLFFMQKNSRAISATRIFRKV